VKRLIEYESETVLPDEISRSFTEMEKNILEHEYEIDKILVYLGNFKFGCITWFADHETLIEEETL
jgi:hypothetical protein